MNKLFKVIFVLGAPGSGKGTQCSQIVKHFPFQHLSAGDLLRAEREKGGEVGALIGDLLVKGTIVPAKITVGLLKNEMYSSRKDKGLNHFLIDGFPRNADNHQTWLDEMGSICETEFVLFFDVPEDICTQRCISRGVSGSGRTDDNLTSLKARFQIYTTTSKPIIDEYDRLGLVKRITSTEGPEALFESHIKPIFGTYSQI